jgi:hypothetical protein
LKTLIIIAICIYLSLVFVTETTTTGFRPSQTVPTYENIHSEDTIIEPAPDYQDTYTPSWESEGTS